MAGSNKKVQVGVEQRVRWQERLDMPETIVTVEQLRHTTQPPGIYCTSDSTSDQTL